MLSTIVGMPDQGKSLFTAYLVAQVAQEHAVVFASLEDAKHETQRPRVQAARAVLDRVHFTKLILPRDTAKLEALVVKEKAKLVTLDPIAAILTASIYNDQAVRAALAPVAARSRDAKLPFTSLSSYQHWPGRVLRRPAIFWPWQRTRRAASEQDFDPRQDSSPTTPIHLLQGARRVVGHYDFCFLLDSLTNGKSARR